MSPILKVRGHNGQIELWPTKVVITRQGGLAMMTQGLKGSKEIPLRSISAVQFKACDMVTNGYIQFTLLGGNESRGGVFSATKDENTVMFTRGQQQSFKDLKARLDQLIEQGHVQGGQVQVAAPTISKVEQLEKLANLHERGVLSDDEFGEQKAAILGGGGGRGTVAGPSVAGAVVSATHTTSGPVASTDAEDTSPASRGLAIILFLILGPLGVHRFYTGHLGIGLVQLLTFGGCGIWFLIDLLLLLTGTYTDSKGRSLK